MSNYFFRPVLRDLTKGARLEFVREFRYLDEKNVAEELGLGGKDIARTIRDYERNATKPLQGRLEELANLYEVSIDAIRDYDLSNPIDLIYIAMWQEELMQYFDINIEDISNNLNEYAKDVVKGRNEWKEMKEKRENMEIPIQEYIDWKLNFVLKI
jgi:transcriptional regulator with XRE-family HTH domain